MAEKLLPLRYNLKQLDPTQGRLILVREVEGLTQEAVQQLADDLIVRLGVSCTLIVVKKLSDIRTMSESEMQQHGWVRGERLKHSSGQTTMALAHLQLVLEEAANLEKLVDMSECPHEDGSGRAVWAIKKVVELLTPVEEVTFVDTKTQVN